MESCKGTILFSISNEQGDYARCMEIMQKIQEGVFPTGTSLIDIKICPYAILNAQSVKKMADEVEVIEDSSNLKSIRLEDYNILFKVLCNDNENDIVNLQFFFLVKKWLLQKTNIGEGRVGLYIKSSQTDEEGVYALHYKATEFLTYQCTENTPYYIDDWRKHRKEIDVSQIKPKSDVILRKFSPLIEIVDADNMGVGYWQQTMGDFIQRCREKSVFWEKIDSFTVLKADEDNARRKRILT